MTSQTGLKLYYFTPALAWFVIILFATLSNLNDIRFLNWHDLFSYDKPIHIILFGTQSITIAYGFNKNNFAVKGNYLIAITLFTSALGAGIEYLQVALTTTRYFDYFDMLANTIGAIVAYIIIRKRKGFVPFV